MNDQNVNNLEDMVIRCCDCLEDFTWLRGEQIYFRSKRLSPPRRCKSCRQARKNSIVPDEAVRYAN